MTPRRTVAIERTVWARPLAVLDELAGAAWDLAAFDEEGLPRAREVIDSYRDQDIGVADASIVVLAERYRTRSPPWTTGTSTSSGAPDGGYFEVLPLVG